MGVIKTLTTVGGLTTAAAGGLVETEDVGDGEITLAKIENVPEGQLLGRGAGGGDGPPEQITLGSGLSMSGTTLSSSGGGGSFPAGTVILFAGGTIPDGWLDCDGASVERDSFPDLFDAIGATWGAVDEDHFNVPDLRGRAPIGVGTGDGLQPRDLADFGGEETHTLITSETPAHAHAITDPGHTHSVSDGGHSHGANSGTFRVTGTGAVDLASGTDVGQTDSSTASATTGIGLSTDLTGIVSTGNAGGDGAHENMQPWAALHFIIKT